MYMYIHSRLKKTEFPSPFSPPPLPPLPHPPLLSRVLIRTDVISVVQCPIVPSMSPNLDQLTPSPTTTQKKQQHM